MASGAPLDGKSAKPLYAADPETGNVAWFGVRWTSTASRHSTV